MKFYKEKKLKKIILSIVLASLLISCKKEIEPILKYPSFIIAGQSDGIGIKNVDFDPDEKFVFYSDYYKSHIILDLNSDSIGDFELVYDFPPARGGTFNRYAYIIPLENNAVCILNKNGTAFVKALEFGDTISVKNNWSNSKSYLYTYHYYSTILYPEGTNYVPESSDGDWYNRDNIFAGVKIVKGNNELYGWIDLAILKEEYIGILRRYSITKPFYE